VLIAQVIAAAFRLLRREDREASEL
jgi:hypothetical protein